MDIVAYLLTYGLDIKDRPGETFVAHPHETDTKPLKEQHGLCRAISYIIQSLSAEKAFGAKLASPIKAQLPQKTASPGNAADFLINVSLDIDKHSFQQNSQYRF